MALIECCLSNVSGTTRTALDESEHSVRETICLDRCGTCYENAFFVVDGELHTDESHRDLIERLDSEVTE